MLAGNPDECVAGFHSVSGFTGRICCGSARRGGIGSGGGNRSGDMDLLADLKFHRVNARIGIGNRFELSRDVQSDFAEAVTGFDDVFGRRRRLRGWIFRDER